ncbi:MAG: hypothetical protein HDR38_07100 [Treponema sp.]|nr:hypothetical protein [Treponema sp.]
MNDSKSLPAPAQKWEQDIKIQARKRTKDLTQEQAKEIRIAKKSSCDLRFLRIILIDYKKIEKRPSLGTTQFPGGYNAACEIPHPCRQSKLKESHSCRRRNGLQS